MWRQIFATVVLLEVAVCSSARGAQVTIENPKNLPANQAEINLLYIMVCQEVAEAFHIPDYKKLAYPLTLVLGEERERYVIDRSTHVGMIYLQKWDEFSFASSAATVVVHHVYWDQKFRFIVIKALQRFASISPVMVSDAKSRRCP